MVSSSYVNSQFRVERKAENERAETKSGRSMSFSAFQFLLRKISARRSVKWRAEFFILNVISRPNRNDSISAWKMIQVALFLSTYFPVCLRPNSAGNIKCCDFVTCHFILPLKVSLFHIFLISLDRVEQCRSTCRCPPCSIY